MTQRLPPLESLRFFEACARHGNFTQAATELAVTPAAVSLRIRNLETALGQVLFERNGPRIALTDIGLKLSFRMAEIMSLLRIAVQESKGAVETIRVTAAPTFAARFLVPRLASYEAEEGAASIQLSASTELEPNARFDVAVRSGRGGWPGLKPVAKFPIEVTPMFSPSIGLANAFAEPEDILTLPLLPDEGWARWFEEAGIDGAKARFAAVSYPSQDLAATAAAAGAGVALISPALFEPLLRDGVLIQPFAHVCTRPDAYHLLVHSGEARPSVLRFCEWLCAAAQGVGENPA